MAIQNIDFKRTILPSSRSFHYNGCQFQIMCTFFEKFISMYNSNKNHLALCNRSTFTISYTHDIAAVSTASSLYIPVKSIWKKT